MRIKIEVKCNNAAFDNQPASELARILRDLAKDIERGCDDRPLLDCNGNTVGRYEIEED